MRRGIGVCLLALAATVPLRAYCQQYDGVDAYEEYGKRVHAAQEVAPIGDSIFGDQVSLYNGATHFEVTDVSIPGNSALPVAVGRDLSIEDQRMVPVGGGALRGFGDWSLDVPYVWGTFTEANGWLLGNGATNRCSNTTSTPDVLLPIPGAQGAPVPAPLEQIWNGNELHIPGQGNQTLLANTESKSYAYTGSSVWKWVTTGNWKLSCIGSVTNLAGEGFKAISPSGVSYTFNYAVTAPTSPFEWAAPSGVGNQTTAPMKTPRVNVYLLATHVEDRFGNWVDYSYSNGHLTGISSNDGRSITLTWSGDEITTVTSALGTWHYGYATASWTNDLGITYNTPYLQTVTRPDGSQWSYAIDAGSLMTNKLDWALDDGTLPPNHCQVESSGNGGSFQYTVRAPSGASATYWFAMKRHYRSYVPKGCLLSSDPNLLYPLDTTTYFDTFALNQKQVSGPGLPTELWKYDYGSVPRAQYFRSDIPWSDPSNAQQPYEPSGTCSSCDASKVVTVTGPTNITQYTYGVEYARNEGQLLKKEVTDLSGQVLESTAYTYVSDAQAPGEPFPDIAGWDQRGGSIDAMGNRIRPVVTTQTKQDNVTFTTTVPSFDVLARTTSTTESSSLGSRTTATNYADNPSLWVLGQPLNQSINGTPASKTDYNAQAEPVNTWQFGKLKVARSWNADGTLHTLTDGNNHVTTLSDWKRGLPQTLTFADGTKQTAVVNDAGWITSVTDENGFANSYGYDAMGRLASISYPTGDDVAWNQTLLSFAPVAGSEYGIPAGHWKQTVHTGNGYSVTYFDAFWRPLVTEHYDSANKSATLSQVAQRYDAGGRKVFTSYPANNITSYSTASVGTHTTYDALGRVTEVDQDSELGPLPTTTSYLPGFMTEVTDPRGNSTTTGYQAFGEPTTQWPVSVTAPQGELTVILRNAFGNPLSVTRTGTAQGSPQLVRSYVYDAYQQLCKQIEPEAGATAFGYDGAGNLAWSASGLDLPNTASCDAGTAQASGRVVTRSYDTRNRVTALTYADNASNTSYGYAADGALISQTMTNAGHPVTTLYSYDKRRLLVQETLTVPNTRVMSIGYGHDANGHLAANTWPDSRTLSYTPNALGQPTRAGSYATGASYYPNGSLAGFTYGSGAVHAMTENERGMPNTTADVLDETPGMSLDYEYDGNGNVAAITDYLPGGVGNVDMTYDALDRLVEADSPMFGGNGKALYSYDLLDNLVGAQLGNVSSFAYVYNARNQLSALKDPGSGSVLTSYSYDAQGNLAARNGQVYQFDQGNRLRNVPGVASYLYDATGRRVQKTELGTGKQLDSQYDKAGQLMFQWNPTNQNATDYIYLDGTLVARVVGNTSEVIGNIDGVSTAATPTVDGWACSTGIAGSIGVELFVGGPSGQGTRIATVTANKPSEGAIAAQCQTSGTAYRFSIPLDTGTRGQYGGKAIYMYGDSPVDNGNNALTGSGTYDVPPNPTAPPAPASISVPSTSSTGSITVTWAASSGATSYVLEQQMNGGAWTQVYSGSATSKAISGLGGGTYVYRVEACNANGCSGFTTSGNLVVALKPPTPSSISVPATSSTGSVTVSWATASGATSYVLQQQLNGGSWTQAYSGSATSKALSGLGDGSYVYRVQACNANGCSGWETSGTLTVALIPATPGSLSVPATSSTGDVTVSWASSSHATSYVLQQQINSGSWTQAYNGSATSRAISGLGNGSYNYRVQACNGNGCSGWRTSGTLTVALIPAAPASISVPASSYSPSIAVSWSASANASSYGLYQSANGGSWTSVYTGSARSHTVTVSASGSYKYEVKACGAGGCSSFTVSGSVAVTLPPAAPHLSGPSSSSTGTFTLTWTKVSGATSYHLHQSFNGGTSALIEATSGTSWTSSALMGGSYAYSVCADNVAGCGPSSNTVTVSVAAHAPAIPAPIHVPGIVTVNVPFGVSWTAKSGATRYELTQTDQSLGIGPTTVYSGSGTSTVITLTGRVNRVFLYSARACNSAGCSGWVSAGTDLTGSGTPMAEPAAAGSNGQ
jgi:YD repeat-containing protein